MRRPLFLGDCVKNQALSAILGVVSIVCVISVVCIVRVIGIVCVIGFIGVLGIVFSGVFRIIDMCIFARGFFIVFRRLIIHIFCHIDHLFSVLII